MRVIKWVISYFWDCQRKKIEKRFDMAIEADKRKDNGPIRINKHGNLGKLDKKRL